MPPHHGTPDYVLRHLQLANDPEEGVYILDRRERAGVLHEGCIEPIYVYLLFFMPVAGLQLPEAVAGECEGSSWSL